MTTDRMRPNTIIRHLLLLPMLILLAGCYSHRPRTSDALPVQRQPLTAKQMDSISFSTTHHYTNGYNFVVSADSLVLMRQQPEERLSGLPTDSFSVRHHAHVVVADIRKIPNDSIDSLWIQLATEDYRFGWIHESSMTTKVVPDDPISQFIMVFSNVHLLVFLIIIVVISLFYLIRKIFEQKAHLVHFNDIHSFYPTCLCLLVATSATLYGSIQLFAPEVWRHFYYHPTLNPFEGPTLISLFPGSVWAMFIIAIAAIDDVRHFLPTGEGLLYVAGLVGVCALDYIIFSLSTLYYIGYPLLVAYVYFAVRQYFRHGRLVYKCGNCGATLTRKGRCPYCGMMNV